MRTSSTTHPLFVIRGRSQSRELPVVLPVTHPGRPAGRRAPAAAAGLEFVSDVDDSTGDASVPKCQRVSRPMAMRPTKQWPQQPADAGRRAGRPRPAPPTRPWRLCTPTVMYPEATIPVLQISMPTLDPQRLLQLGERLRPLRDEGVLIIGSGFTTHGLPFLDDPSPDADSPEWSTEFNGWARELFAAGDVDALIDFRNKAPGMPSAHPTIEHFSPLFVASGASRDPAQSAKQVIDGFWMGLAKRSIELI